VAIERRLTRLDWTNINKCIVGCTWIANVESGHGSSGDGCQSVEKRKLLSRFICHTDPIRLLEIASMLCQAREPYSLQREVSARSGRLPKTPCPRVDPGRFSFSYRALRDWACQRCRTAPMRECRYVGMWNYFFTGAWAKRGSRDGANEPDVIPSRDRATDGLQLGG
jgi:hypothetical protein